LAPFATFCSNSGKRKRREEFEQKDAKDAKAYGGEEKRRVA